MESMNVFKSRSNVYTDKLGDVEILDTVLQSSSDGNLKKWRVMQKESGKMFWLKGSSVDYSDTDLFECESECLASHLALKLGFSNVVLYELDTLHCNNEEIKVCYSEEFDENDVAYYAEIAPGATNFVGKEKFDFVCSLDYSMKPQIQDVLLFDILIGNKDRHLHNLALNVSKGEILIFDCGDSLLSQIPSDRLRLYNTSFRFHKCRPFFDTVGKQIELIDHCTFNSVSKDYLKQLVQKYLPKQRQDIVLNYLRDNFSKVEQYFGISILTE